MKRIFVLIILILFVNPAFAENYNIFRLENGQTIIVKEVKTNPIVTIDTWIKTGSINENEGNNGVSHFLEHLFFKGSKNYAPGEFDKILETKGAITNAATSKDFTHYYITIPSSEFDLALHMHADMLTNPLIPRKELEKERKVVIEEIMKDANSPNHLVFENLNNMLYTQHPYKRKVIGTKDIISNIQRDEILNYYNKFYNPSNMITIIIGDIDTNYVIEKVKQEFDCDYKTPEKITNKKEKPLTTQKRTIANSDTQIGYMLIGYRGTEIDNPDSYALDILSTILGDGRSSVFYRNIKEDKRLANSIGASNSGYKEDGIFYISATFEPEKQKKLEENIFSEINNIQKNGITDEQLNIAKNIIERDTYYERESIANIAGEIGYVFVTTGDVKYYESYLDNIKKVSINDVKRVANKYLKQEKSAVSIVLPSKTNEIEISNTTKQTPKPQLISETNTTQKYKLSNGVTLLHTPNEVNNIVAISIFSKGGELTEYITGTASITASAILKGTKTYSQNELSQILEENGIKIIPSSQNDSFSITILTTQNELDKTFSILDDIVNNATLNDFDIEKVKTDKLNSIKKSKDIPLNIAIDNYKTLIFENSPYAMSNKILEQSIPKITSKNVKDYYSKIFNPENMIISVNGNVEKEKLFDEFTNIFYSKNNEQFSYNNYSIPPLKTKKQIIHKIKDLKTDWIIMGWQVAGALEYKEYATLQVINSMLGSGMSSRLFKNLRDKDGLAYQLGSQYSPNVLKGAFIVYIGTNPENLDYAQKRLKEEVFRLKNEFVTSKELKEAKDKLLGRYIIGQETNLDKATTIGWFEASGRGYEFQYTDLINSVTESDIIEVANKYFNENFVLSIVKPE